MEHVSKERLLEILQTYVDNDLSAAEPEYVREVLTETCGMTQKEIEDCGLSYIFPDDWWEEC